MSAANTGYPCADQPAWAGHDERVHAVLVDQRAHRVNPRPAVTAYRGQERQSHSELVQQGVGRLGHARLALLELAPGDYGPSLRTIETQVKQTGKARAVHRMYQVASRRALSR